MFNATPDLPKPRGACTYRWEDINTSSPFRYFEYPTRFIERSTEGPIEVFLCGSQSPGAPTEAGIVVAEFVRGGWTDMVRIDSIAAARGLAQALMAAADEWETLAV